METPQIGRIEGTDAAFHPDSMVDERFRVPKSWRQPIGEAARAQGISKADLYRLLVRKFLRERYEDDDRKALTP